MPNMTAGHENFSNQDCRAKNVNFSQLGNIVKPAEVHHSSGICTLYLLVLCIEIPEKIHCFGELLYGQFAVVIFVEELKSPIHKGVFELCVYLQVSDRHQLSAP